MDNAGPIINPSSFLRREFGKTMFKLPNCKRNDNLRFSVSLVLELNKILVKRRKERNYVPARDGILHDVCFYTLLLMESRKTDSPLDLSGPISTLLSP